MAIKTQSQLVKFDNGTTSNTKDIGKNLALFDGKTLTDLDKTIGEPKSPEGWYQTDWRRVRTNYSDGREKPSIDTFDSNHYWKSIFEISQPISAGAGSTDASPTDASQRYDSRSTTYEDIAKNILWDVKSYLNYRNNLNDYNLSDIVDGTQYFFGTKYLNGSLNVVNLSADDLSAASLTAYNTNLSTVQVSALTATTRLSAANLTAYSSNLSTVQVSALTATTRLSAANLSAYNTNLTNLTANALTVNSTSQFNDNVTIANGKWINGYAKGLKSNSSTLLSVGNTTTPVYFNNGVPVIVSNTAKALSAKYLVDDNWTGLSVGTAGLITTPYDKQYTVVKFVNGVPSACNEIDYAHHAYWSDVGEKYLADKEYEPGTLVKFGGEKEITIADDEVNAIVSTHAFDLNACLSGGTVICLCGRVPTKVIGKIDKFDRIMLSHVPGIACKWDGSCKPIGRALESNDDEGIKLVECVSQFMV